MYVGTPRLGTVRFFGRSPRVCLLDIYTWVILQRLYDGFRSK